MRKKREEKGKKEVKGMEGGGKGKVMLLIALDNVDMSHGRIVFQRMVDCVFFSVVL